MIEKAIVKVEKLVRATMSEIIDLYGCKFLKVGSEVKPIHAEGPAIVGMKTLDGFCTFANKYSASGADRDKADIYILTPSKVILCGQMQGTNHNSRWTYAQAVLDMHQFVYGNYYPLDEMIIQLMTNFEQTSEVAKFLHIFGTTKDSVVRTHLDDGASQSVTVEAGIDRDETARIPNPVTLRPYRTFLEVEQPESVFVVRLKSAQSPNETPTAAIFEADGGTWRAKAAEAIAEHLTLNITDPDVIIHR